MIPPFTELGYLPPGEHLATWEEIVARFGTIQHRRDLIAGLGQALRLLQKAGCLRVYIDGSFITDKESPEDYDVCWDLSGVDIRRLHPLFLPHRQKHEWREAQKMRFLGEFFIAASSAAGVLTYVEYFQVDKEGRAKGIITLDLGGLP